MSTSQQTFDLAMEPIKHTGHELVLHNIFLCSVQVVFCQINIFGHQLIQNTTDCQN